MKLLLNTKELAEALNLSPRTVEQYAAAFPANLPPKTKLPGTRKNLWRVEDVEKWLADLAEKSKPVTAS